MTLAQLQIEAEAKRTRGRKRRKIKAVQTEFPMDCSFALITENAPATAFVEPIDPERAPSLFANLRANIEKISQVRC